MTEEEEVGVEEEEEGRGSRVRSGLPRVEGGNGEKKNVEEGLIESWGGEAGGGAANTFFFLKRI